MRDILSDLYYGEIRPHDKSIPEDSEAARLSDTFSENEDWLTEHLEGAAKNKLLNLLNCHSELTGLLSYESFRKGFILGASMVMEVCYGDQEEGSSTMR